MRILNLTKLILKQNQESILKMTMYLYKILKEMKDIHKIAARNFLHYQKNINALLPTLWYLIVIVILLQDKSLITKR